jgi:hypothetical protein
MKQQCIDLAERCEAADGGDQREILLAGFSLVASTLGATDDNKMKFDFPHLSKFMDMLDCGAYESAAMKLLPKGCFWAITMRGVKRGGYHACCQLSGDLDWREAKTPALALLAAICRAMGEG